MNPGVEVAQAIFDRVYVDYSCQLSKDDAICYTVRVLTCFYLLITYSSSRRDGKHQLGDFKPRKMPLLPLANSSNTNLRKPLYPMSTPRSTSLISLFTGHTTRRPTYQNIMETATRSISGARSSPPWCYVPLRPFTRTRGLDLFQVMNHLLRTLSETALSVHWRLHASLYGYSSPEPLTLICLILGGTCHQDV